METWQRFKKWLAEWEQRQAIKWEERHIVQYRRQIWAAVDGIKESKRRIERAQKQ